MVRIQLGMETLKMNSLLCDLCDSNNLEFIYQPKGSTRFLKVFVCRECGLTQSFPKIDHINERNIAVSGSANWGNLRYGKGFRTKHDIELISNYLDLKKIKRCLDIGSNRGSFYKEMVSINERVEFWGVEPDIAVISDYPLRKSDTIINDRFENIELSKDYFDLIYCSHTLEHVKSPMDTLTKIYLSLDNSGLLYLEIPNIEFLNTSDIIEEWFIDKHLYHFSSNTVLAYLNTLGFSILYCSNNSDMENISIVAQKGGKLKELVVNDYQSNKDLIQSYSSTITSNILHVKEIAKYLNNLANKNKLVIWGGGRIFDVIVKIGGLDPENIHGLIDKYLHEYVEATNGIKISKPSELKGLNPQIVFICSREYSSQIELEIIDLQINTKVICYSNVFQDIM